MVSTLLGMDVHRMQTLAEKWGNVPRLLVRYMDWDDGEIEALYRQNASHAVRASRIIMEQGPRLDLPNNAPSRFYFLRPMRTPTGAISRGHSCLAVPTQTIRYILAKALKREDNLVRLQFYNALSYHPNTRSAAGFIFESWFHSFFITKKTIDCRWVAQGSGNAIVQFPTASTTESMAFIPSTQSAPGSAPPPYYWILSKTNFRDIDSALVLEDEIFVFQMTISSTHRSPIEGLRCLQKMLPPEMRDLPWRVVFVGPNEGPIKAVAEYWSKRLRFPQNECPAVGWSAMDPAQTDVTYKVCKIVDSPVAFNVILRNITTSLIWSRRSLKSHRWRLRSEGGRRHQSTNNSHRMLLR